MGVAFSPDGSLLASGGSGVIWNPSTGDLIGTLRPVSRIVYSVAFSPDGSLLAAGIADNTINIWETASSPLNSPAVSVVSEATHSPPALAPARVVAVVVVATVLGLLVAGG